MCLKFRTKTTHLCLQVITFLQSNISKLLESRAGCGALECIPLQNKDNFLAPATLQPEETADTSKGSEKTEYSRTPNVLPPFQPSPPLSVVVQAAMLPRACSGIRAGSCA